MMSQRITSRTSKHFISLTSILSRLRSTTYNMRHAIRLLASPSTLGSSSGFNPAPLTLLPPIPLYRRILRAHRKFLKPDERIIGDGYVKSEFRSHRNVENPIHIVGFLNEWQRYTQQVEGESWQGTKLDTDKIDKMSGMYLPTRCS